MPCRPRRFSGGQWSLWLVVLILMAGCVNFRSQPRFTHPEPDQGGQAPAQTPGESQARRPEGVREEKKEERTREEKRAEKTERRNARKLKRLSTTKLFTKGALDLLKSAEDYLGTPYRYGGDSSRGMDCSGLVWRSVKDAWNRDLPRSSAKMAELGMPVSRVELEPGDFLFFYTGSRHRISHVGIYEGAGRFIHSSTTKGVEWASMDEGYWKRRLICARRMSPSSIP